MTKPKKGLIIDLEFQRSDRDEIAKTADHSTT